MSGGWRDRVLLHAAVFLASAATLLFEMAQIRAFSFSLPPMLAYSGISFAMLGFGAGAMYVSLAPRIAAGDPRPRLAALALLEAAAIVLSAALFARVSSPAVEALADNPLPALFGVILPCTLPYFFGGVLLAAVFSSSASTIGRLYFSNLFGSGLGAVLMAALVSPLGVERLILISAAAASVAALLLAITTARRFLTAVAGLGAVACIALAPAAVPLMPFAPDPTDALGKTLEKTVALRAPVRAGELSGWNIVARVDVWSMPGVSRVPEPIAVKMIAVDAGAVTLALGDPGKPGWGRDLFERTLYGVGYSVKPKPADVLVIGAGGGTDVQTALHHGAKRVTAVEINTTTIEMVEGPLADFLAWPKSKHVRLVHADGRTYTKTTKRKFDLIQMSGVDTVTVNATGAFHMVEENLYTVEAFQDYLGALEEDGVLSCMRFGAEHLRLSAIAMEALWRKGADLPLAHIIALDQAALGGILVSKRPFTKAQIDAVCAFTERRERTALRIPLYEMYGLRMNEPIRRVHLPGVFTHKSFTDFFAKAVARRDDTSTAATGLSIPTDDAPYYLFTNLLSSAEWLLSPLQDALSLLVRFWIAVIALALALIVAPAAVFGRRLSSRGPLKWVLPYFFGIGAAFMLLEIGIINRFAVFVGSPGASMAVVLTALLVSSGIGARVCDALPARPAQRILIAAAAVIAYSLLLWAFSAAVFDVYWKSGFNHVARGLAAGALIVPLGFFMGWLFPSGIALIQARHPDAPLVPWAVSVNGFASVVGSVAALPCTLYFGFSVLFAVALVCYGLAALATFAFARSEA